MSRLLAAVLLIAGALILALVLLVPVAQTVPASIHAAEHGGTVDLAVDDTTVMTTADCVNAQWHVEGIRAVELDRRGVTGEGTRPSCTATIRLDVTFQDGTKETYTIPKQVRTASTPLRALMVVALFLFGLGVVVSGLPITVWRALRASAPGRALDRLLPRLNSDPHGARTSIGVLFAVTAIVLVGAAVRTHYLSRTLRFDEAWTYNEFASQSPQFIAIDYRAPNNHILHTLLVHVSTQVFGVYPWTLRLPVYFAGILIIAATFAAARRFYGIRIGLLAAALAAGASWLVEYSANARGYNLITVAFLLQLCLAWTLRRRSSRAGWIAFAVLGALGLYTVPTMAYPLGVVCVWLGLSILIEQRGPKRWRLLRDMVLAVLLLLAMTGLLYLPVFLYLHSGVDRNFDFANLEQITWAPFIEILREELTKVWLAWNRDLSVWVGAALLIGAVASVLFHSRTARFRVSLLVAALLWLPAAVFLQMVITYDRLWVFLQPLYLILASAGLVCLWRLITTKRLWPQVSAVAAGAVVVAVVSGAGTVQSNSVELTPDGVIGIQPALLNLRQTLPQGSKIYCAHKCPVYEFYGLMYGLPIFDNSLDSPPEQAPVYLADSMTDGAVNFRNDMGLLNLDPDQFEPATLVISLGDTRVYRLDPIAP